MSMSSCIFFPGQRDIEAKVGVVSLISEHLHIVLWLHSMGLLPEHAGLYVWLLGKLLLYQNHLLMHNWITFSICANNSFDRNKNGKWWCLELITARIMFHARSYISEHGCIHHMGLFEEINTLLSEARLIRWLMNNTPRWNSILL